MSKVTTTFEAVDTGMVATIQKIERETKSMVDTTQKAEKQMDFSFGAMAKAGAGFAAGIGLVKGAFATLTGTLDQFTQALDLGGRLNDLSARTGETAGNLLLLERAFDNSGVGADRVGSSINKLQKFMADANTSSKENAKALSDLGLSYSALAELTPTQQLALFAERINAISNPTERAAMAMKIFGKSGGELLPLLQGFSGELGNAKDELGSMVDIMNQRSAIFDTVSDKMTVIKGKFMEFAAGILDKAAPALEIFTTMLSKIDAAGLGQKLAGSFAGLKDAALTFSDILIGGIMNAKDGINLIKLSLVFAAQEFGNLLLDTIPRMAKLIASSLIPGFKTAFNEFKLLAYDATRFFGEKLLDAYVAAAFVWSDKAGQAAQKQANQVKNGFQIVAEQYAMDIADANLKIEQDFEKVRQKINSEKPVDYFGAEGTKEEISKLAGELKQKGQEFRENFTDIPLSFNMESEAKVKSALEFGKVKDFFKDLSKEQPDPLEKMKTSAEKVSVKMDKIVEKVKELTLLEKLDQQLIEARTAKESKIKPLEEEFKKQVESGKFRQAKATMRQIEKRQEEAAIRIDEKGEIDRRDINAIAREEGIKTGGKSKEQIRKEILEKRKEKKPEEQKKEAEKKEAEKKEAEKKVEDKADALFKMVEAIKELVAKIEPKLPTHALAL